MAEVEAPGVGAPHQGEPRLAGPLHHRHRLHHHRTHDREPRRNRCDLSLLKDCLRVRYFSLLKAYLRVRFVPAKGLFTRAISQSDFADNTTVNYRRGGFLSRQLKSL